MRQGKDLAAGKFIQREGERSLPAGGEGIEVGQIGSGTETEVEWESQAAGRFPGAVQPVIDRIKKEGREIEEVGFRSGHLEIGDEGLDPGQGFVTGGLTGGGIGIEEEEVGTASEGPGGG